jgi:hypothetical protein
MLKEISIRIPSFLNLLAVIWLGSVIASGKLPLNVRGPECSALEEVSIISWVCLALAMIGGALLGLFTFKKSSSICKSFLIGGFSVLIGSIVGLWYILGYFWHPLWDYSYVVLPYGSLIGLGTFGGLALGLVYVRKGLNILLILLIGFLPLLAISCYIIFCIICCFYLPAIEWITYPLPFSCDIALGSYLGFTISWSLAQKGLDSSKSALIGLLSFFFISGCSIGMGFFLSQKEGFIGLEWRSKLACLTYTLVSLNLIKQIVFGKTTPTNYQLSNSAYSKKIGG